MENSKKINIAITGANGFIGTHLVRELERRKMFFEILDKKKYNLFDKKSLKEFVSKKDIIVHLAGINKDGSLKDLLNVNVLGTQILLDAITAYNKNVKLIFASSFGVYQEHDIFGLSKKMAEELINKHASKYGFESIILRYSNIYGLGAKPFTNSAIATFSYLIKEGKPIVLHGDGTQERDYLYIDDAIRALFACFQFNSQRNEIYDVCSGTMTSLEKLVKIITSVSKKPVLVKNEHNTEAQLFKNNSFTKRPLPNWRSEVTLEEGLKIVLNE